MSNIFKEISKNPNLVIIGDVHGKINPYLNICDKYEYSLQIGDLDFDYKFMNQLDPEKHFVIFGNHDNYTKILNEGVPNNLGDFGVHRIPGFPFDGKFFFLRGAYSIDKMYRQEGTSWWPEEELTIEQGYRAIELYEKEKPKIVITHEAPKSLIDKGIIGLPGLNIETRTATLLQTMLDIHKPLCWIHAHHHTLSDVFIDGTRFICLPELGTAEIKLGDFTEQDSVYDLVEICKKPKAYIYE